MGTKTITIDLETYNRLRKFKRPDESLAEALKRVVPEPFDLDRWLKTVRRNGISDETANAVERHVATRKRRSRPRR